MKKLLYKLKEKTMIKKDKIILRVISKDNIINKIIMLENKE